MRAPSLTLQNEEVACFLALERPCGEGESQDLHAFISNTKAVRNDCHRGHCKESLRRWLLKKSKTRTWWKSFTVRRLLSDVWTFNTKFYHSLKLTRSQRLSILWRSIGRNLRALRVTQTTQQPSMTWDSGC